MSDAKNSTLWPNLSSYTPTTIILSTIVIVLVILVVLHLVIRVFRRRKRHNHDEEVEKGIEREKENFSSDSDDSERVIVEASQDKPEEMEIKGTEEIEIKETVKEIPSEKSAEKTAIFFGKEYETNYPSPKTVSKDAPKSVPNDVPKEIPHAPRAPILRCYDFFEFPGDGAFHVKTCGTQSTSATVDVSKPGSFTPTRIFVQWFPVEGAKQYTIYCNYGMNVSTDNNDKITDTSAGYIQKWAVSGSNYYYETEAMITDPKNGKGCFSVVVTASNDDSVESPASKIFSTC